MGKHTTTRRGREARQARHARRVTVAAVLGLIAAALALVAVPTPAEAVNQYPVTSPTAACTAWTSVTVPAGVTSVTAILIGGGGGGGSGAQGFPGGGGARVETTSAVTPGQTLWQRTGCGGSGWDGDGHHGEGGSGYTTGGLAGEGGNWSNKGGGGGGSSAICIGGSTNCSGATVLAIAGGGGGGGASQSCSGSTTGGTGGTAGIGAQNSGTGYVAANGQAGTNGGNGGGGGGGGGTNTGAGTIQGNQPGTDATNGSGGNGGNGGIDGGNTQNTGGGGGGAGWYGGAGGGADYCITGTAGAGAGGAGSSYINTTVTTSGRSFTGVSTQNTGCGQQSEMCTSFSTAGAAGTRNNTGSAGSISLTWNANPVSIAVSATQSGPASSTANIGAYTVSIKDYAGNNVTANVDTTINLSSNSTGTKGFSTTSGGAVTGSSFVIPAGQATGTFYYGDNRVGTPTITVSSSGYTSVTTGATVTARSSTTATSCSPSSVQHSAVSTCTSTVTDTATGGKITPTGTVTATAASGSIGSSPCTLAQVSLGVASCSFAYNNAVDGSYSVTGTYSATSAHASSNGAGNVTVTNPTSTTVSCTPSPGSVGNSTTCSIFVTDIGANPSAPSGTASLGASPSGLTISGSPCTLLPSIGAQKVCSITVSSATVNTYSLTANYSPSDGHTSSSGTASLSVAAHPTSTTVSCTSPVQHGVTSTCTATVTDTLASGTKITPTGTVTGTAPSGTIGASPCTLAQVSLGTASCSFSYAANLDGTVAVTGTYSPTSPHTASNGNSNVTVSNPTTTTVSCSPSPVLAGNGSTCTLTVTDTGPSPSAPAGTVALGATPGGLTIGSSPCTLGSPVGASRSCAVSVISGTAGSYDLTATYTSSDGHGTSQGTSTLVVARHATSTAISCSPSSVHRNATSTCTATVTDNLVVGNRLTPTGTVTGSAPSGTIGSSPCTLVEVTLGEASCTFTYASSTPGTVTVTGTYDPSGANLTSSGTSSVTVTAPTADDQSVTARRGIPLAIDLTGSDPLGGPVTFTVPVDAPTKGTLDCTGAACTYTAGAGQTGSDSFTFRVTDEAGATATATVSITIANDPPVASGQTVGVTAQIAKPITLSATDPNGDPITYEVATEPTKGTVSCSSAGACTYTSTGNGFGADSFTFTASDGFGGTDTETIAINITAPAPTITGDRTPPANVNGWNNEPVTVSFTCGSDALESCTSPVTVSTDGAGQSVTGTAQDLYGQTASTTVSDISIDQVDPSIIGVATTAPNAAGWYKAPVEMAWLCEDTLSGITSGVCPSPSTTVGEGTSVSVSESVHDRAGNQASATSQSVKVDLTPPSTGVSTPPTWSNSSVTLTLSPSDALSGVASTHYRVDGGADQTGTSPVVTGQGHHVVTYWSIDHAGNEETHASVGVDIDTSAPSIHASVAPAPNGNGWHKGSAAVTFTCDDTDSGVASCTGDASFSTEVDTVVTGHAEDHAGNTATDTATVRIDLSAPTIAAQVPPANGNGWFNAPVQVPFSCSDTGGSGVASCPTPAMFAGEGANQVVTGTVVDNAGNEGTASGDRVSVDLTAPTITGAALNGSNGNGGYYGNVTVRWTCNDALSGVTSCPADQVVSGEGVHVVTGSVSDRAGNTSSGEVTIRIDHDPSTDPGFVHGRITDRVTGDPVPGAYVSLRGPNREVLYTTTAGTDGTYSFPALADGAYKLYADLRGAYQGSYWPSKSDFVLATPITVAHGSNITADQALAPGLVISGTVRNAAGDPIAGTTVRITPSSVAAITDAAGRYQVKGLLPGSYTVGFFAFGYAPFTTPSMALSGDRVVDRTMAATAAGGGLKGKVTAFNGGAPVAGAEIRIWAKDAAVPGLVVTAGADGRYSVPSLPVGSYEISANRVDYQVRWAPDSLSRPGVGYPITTGCASSPDASWGDPCAVPVNIAMRR